VPRRHVRSSLKSKKFRGLLSCARCQLDGAKQRRAAQLRQPIILSGPHAVAFATGHVNDVQGPAEAERRRYLAAAARCAGHGVLLESHHVAALAVQAQELKRLVEMFVGKSAMESGGGANNNALPTGDTTAVAARLAETLAQMQGTRRLLRPLLPRRHGIRARRLI
jgi:hypothetical protein